MEHPLLIILAFLCDNETILISGFMLGFFWSFKFNTETLLRPMGTLLVSILNGCIMMWAAGVVASFTPYGLEFLIPIVAFPSCVFYMLCGLASFRPREPDDTRKF
jgi:heme A synthase